MPRDLFADLKLKQEAYDNAWLDAGDPAVGPGGFNAVPQSQRPPVKGPRDLLEDREINRSAIEQEAGGPFTYEKGVEGFGKRFDLARSTNSQERAKKLQDKMPDAEVKVIKLPATGEDAVVFRPKGETEFRGIDEEGVSMGDLGEFASAVASPETAAGLFATFLTRNPAAGEAAMGLRGAGLATRTAVQGGAAAGGNLIDQGIEGTRGYQTDPLDEIFTQSAEAGGYGMAGEGIGSMFSKAYNALKGGGVIKPLEGVKTAQRAAEEEGLRPLTAGQQHPLFARRENQVAMTSQKPKEAYLQQEQDLRNRIAKTRDTLTGGGAPVLDDATMDANVRDMATEIYSQINAPVVSMRRGGAALQEGRKSFEEKSRPWVKSKYDKAITAGEDATWDIAPLKAKADELRGGIKARGEGAPFEPQKLLNDNDSIRGGDIADLMETINDPSISSERRTIAKKHLFEVQNPSNTAPPLPEISSDIKRELDSIQKQMTELYSTDADTSLLAKRWDSVKAMGEKEAYAKYEKLLDDLLQPVPAKRSQATGAFRSPELPAIQPKDQVRDVTLGGTPQDLLAKTFDSITKMDPSVSKYKGKTGYEQLQVLRSQLGDYLAQDFQKLDPAGRQQWRMAKEMQGVLDSVIDTPKGGSPEFTQAWRRASESNKFREKILGATDVTRLAQSENPADLMEQFARPGETTSLRMFKKVMPADKWTEFQGSFKTKLMAEPEKINSTLKEFRKDPDALRLLLNPKDEAELVTFGNSMEKLNGSTVMKVFKNQADEGKRAVELITKGSQSELTDLIKRNGGHDSAFGKNLRAGVVQDMLDKATHVPKGSDHPVVDPRKLVPIISDYVDSGRLKGVLTPADIQTLTNLRAYAAQLGQTADAGAAISGAETAHGLFNFLDIAKIPFNAAKAGSNALQARALTNPKVTKYVFGTGKTFKPVTELRGAGVALSLIANDMGRNEAPISRENDDAER